MKKHLIIPVLAALTLVSCGGGNSNQNNNSDTTAVATVETPPCDVSTTPPNIILDVWKAYLTSDYCQIEVKNIDTVLSYLEKQGTTAATLTIENEAPVNPDRFNNNDQPSDDEEYDFYEPDPSYYWAYESIAVYPAKSGGYIALWNYDAASWGKKILAVFSYKDNKLTRLKNSFPPLTDDLVDKDPISTDERVNLSGSEVLFLIQDCFADRFTPDGFTILVGGMEEHNFKWNGETFIEQ